MLEGRLRKDCPYAKDTDIQEADLESNDSICKLYSSDDVQGPLEETPELKKQMEEALHGG